MCIRDRSADEPDRPEGLRGGLDQARRMPGQARRRAREAAHRRGCAGPCRSPRAARRTGRGLEGPYRRRRGQAGRYPDGDRAPGRRAHRHRQGLADGCEQPASRHGRGGAPAVLQGPGDAVHRRRGQIRRRRRAARRCPAADGLRIARQRLGLGLPAEDQSQTPARHAGRGLCPDRRAHRHRLSDAAADRLDAVELPGGMSAEGVGRSEEPIALPHGNFARDISRDGGLSPAGSLPVLRRDQQPLSGSRAHAEDHPGRDVHGTWRRPVADRARDDAQAVHPALWPGLHLPAHASAPVRSQRVRHPDRGHERGAALHRRRPVAGGRPARRDRAGAGRTWRPFRRSDRSRARPGP